MAKYKVTDPQSGRSVVVSGDSPPTDTDLEGIFQQAGLREESVAPQANTVSQNLQQNPIANFLQGNSLRISQDFSSGINANMTEGVRTKRNKEAFQQAKKFEEAAAVTQDPMIKKKLLSQANDIYGQVSKAEQEVSQSFSSDVQQNPAWRGLKAGGEVASLANLIVSAPTIARSIGKAGNAVLHPFRLVNSIRDKAIQAATEAGKNVDGDKIIKALEKGAESVPPSEINQYNGFLDTAREQLKGRVLTEDNAVKMLSKANDAYTASGALKESAKAGFEKITGDAIRGQLTPDVQKANHLFRTLYGAQKFVGKAVNPTTIGIGAIATGANYLGRKLIGQ